MNRNTKHSRKKWEEAFVHSFKNESIASQICNPSEGEVVVIPWYKVTYRTIRSWLTRYQIVDTWNYYE